MTPEWRSVLKNYILLIALTFNYPWRSTMKTTALIVMVLATALMVSAASSQEGGAVKNQQEESAKKIKELQKERLEVLSALAEGAGLLAKQGRVSIEEACEARLQFLRAQIEEADTDAQRIKFYENYIVAMQQFEEMAKVRKEGARGTEVTVLKAKASRLEAEIALERLKAKR
ncbi:MAG: hypothetical protein JWP89_5634 [Schlesneria sp.]|nr:hypothetical protein [Schlesneria sp.]